MMIDLKDLTDQTIALFSVSSPEQLGQALLDACSDHEKLRAFCDLVDGDLSKDWMQMIYQYYLADRKDKKQDYTPSSVAHFMGLLAGSSEIVIDMCAGSGALIIQKWQSNKETVFEAIENDKNVIPFLLFNMVIRNIPGTVCCENALLDPESSESWRIIKGDRYGRIVNF